MKVRVKVKAGVLATLVTLGNTVSGFAALVKVVQGRYEDAAWLILLAMVFDALDGRVARLTGTSSTFGQELDSLSDMISFGAAPAVLVAATSPLIPGVPLWPKICWSFSLIFAVGAALRLARFNVENREDESAHLSFKGLPSPGAAGVVASLVILRAWFLHDDEGLVATWIPDGAERVAARAIELGLPVVAAALGYLMTTRIRYTHAVTRFARGRKPFTRFADVVVLVIVAATVPQIVIPLAFLAYALSGPVAYLLRRVFRGASVETTHTG